MVGHELEDSLAKHYIDQLDERRLEVPWQTSLFAIRNLDVVEV